MTGSNDPLEGLIRSTLVAVADSERDAETTLIVSRNRERKMFLSVAAGLLLLGMVGGVLLHGRPAGRDAVTATGTEPSPVSLFPRSLRLDERETLEVRGARRYSRAGEVVQSFAYLAADDVTLVIEVRHEGYGALGERPVADFGNFCQRSEINVRSTSGTIAGRSGDLMHLWWPEPGVGLVHLRAVGFSEAELTEFAESLVLVSGEAWESQVAPAGEIADGLPDGDSTAVTTPGCE